MQNLREKKPHKENKIEKQIKIKIFKINKLFLYIRVI